MRGLTQLEQANSTFSTESVGTFGFRSTAFTRGLNDVSRGHWEKAD